MELASHGIFRAVKPKGSIKRGLHLGSTAYSWVCMINGDQKRLRLRHFCPKHGKTHLQPIDDDTNLVSPMPSSVAALGTVTGKQPDGC